MSRRRLVTHRSTMHSPLGTTFAPEAASQHGRLSVPGSKRISSDEGRPDGPEAGSVAALAPAVDPPPGFRRHVDRNSSGAVDQSAVDLAATRVTSRDSER